MAVHLIWDNSNIFLSGKDTCEQREPGVINYAFRIDFRNLYDLAINARQSGHRYFGGSVPPECKALWGFVKGLGCETNLLHRVERGEQAVDEILHLRIANLILDVDPPETIALLTGDGHTSEFGGSFPEQIERALERGWEVEVYSWECSMSHRAYDPIIQRYPKASYVRLDDYYDSLTFIEEGQYFYTNGGRRNDVFQEGRNAVPLTLPVRHT